MSSLIASSGSWKHFWPHTFFKDFSFVWLFMVAVTCTDPACDLSLSHAL